MKFEEALKTVLKRIKLSEAEHKDFLEDVKIISTEIDKAMEANNSIFKDMLKGLKSTAYYKKDRVVDIVDDMQLHLVFKLPFKVKECDLGRGEVKLITKTKHPIVINNVVDMETFYCLMKGNLELVISKMKPILCTNDRTFKLSYNFPTIVATEQVEVGSKSTINFSFLSLLEFTVNEASKCIQRYGLLVHNSFITFYERELPIMRPDRAGYIRDAFRLLQLLRIEDCCYGADISFLFIACIFRTIGINITSLGLMMVDCFQGMLSKWNDLEENWKKFGISFESPTVYKKLQKIIRYFAYNQLMDTVDMDDVLALFDLS